MVEENKNKATPADPSVPPTSSGTGTLGADVKEKESKEKTVQVKASVLESILAKVEKMEGNEKSLLEKLAMLEATADKSRVATYLAKNSRGELIRTASAWKWRNKFVVATVTVRNESYVDQYGRQIVDQVLKVIWDDGSDTEQNYAQFHKEKELVKGEVVKKSSDETGDFWTLKFPDGREQIFNLVFLN